MTAVDEARAREVLRHFREQARVGMFAKKGHLVTYGEAADTIEMLLGSAASQPGNVDRPITMQDVRLMSGEGKLDAHTVLAACNAVLRNRAR